MREYYQLAKPGIVYGNLLTTIAAFFLASRWHFVSFAGFLELFLATTLGISFVIGSACVFNNYLDRDIDSRMQRTQKRALVTGVISIRNALIYGTILGVIGVEILYWYTNALTAAIAATGFIFYVLIYGAAKRASYWGALVGSIPGAIPIVVGYTSVMNQLDSTALVLFLILVCWQMPHFYAIATYRLQEYVLADIPVLPAKKGMRTTKIHILLFVVGYVFATIALAEVTHLGWVYLISSFVFGGVWFVQAFRGFVAKDDAKWARKLFLLSLIVLLAFCVSITIGTLLP